MAYGDWTQRLWIVQEQCLNRELVMLHGITLLSWDAVATLPFMFGLELLPRLYAELFERKALLESGCTLQEIDMSIYGCVLHGYYREKCRDQTLYILL